MHRKRRKAYDGKVKIEQDVGVFMVMLFSFPIEEMEGEFKVHIAANEEMSAGRSFQSPVNCGTVTHISAHIYTHRLGSYCMYTWKNAIELTLRNLFSFSIHSHVNKNNKE